MCAQPAVHPEGGSGENALGVTGTPSYVVGDEVVHGAVGVPRLRAKIENERK